MIVSSGKVPQPLWPVDRTFWRACVCLQRANRRDGGVGRGSGGKALLRCSEGRTEIAQFVVDLLGFPYGLGDFFAE